MSRCLMVAWLLCAWVLWSHTEWLSTSVGGKPNDRWAIGEVFDARQACEQFLEAAVAKRLAEKPTQGYRSEVIKRGLAVTMLNATEEQRAVNKSTGIMTGGILTEMRCLPSGTDPRPRGND